MKINKVLVVGSLSLLIGNVQAGIVGSIALGASVAGGAAAASGAAVGAIATAAIAGGASAAASYHGGGGRSRNGGTATVGVSMNGNGRLTGGIVEYRDSRRNIDLKFKADSHTYHKEPSLPAPPLQTNPFDTATAHELPRQGRMESEKARSFLKTPNPSGWKYGLINYKGSELCYASNAESTVVISPERGRYSIEETTESFEHIAHFTPKNSVEREAMKSFIIEDTIKTWHFTQLLYNGVKFNKAYTDTSEEIWVRAGETIQIAATKRDKKARAIQREQEWRAQEEARRQREQQQLQQKRQQEQKKEQPIQRRRRVDDRVRGSHVTFGDAESYKDAAKLYVNEAFWAANESIKRAEVSAGKDLDGSREASRTFVSYYEKAVDLVRSIGDYVSNVAREFATIGGVENQRRYALGKISYEEYLSNIAGDVASDAAAAAFGAKIGGGTGTALAIAGPKNPAAVSGMSAAGAKMGSTAAVVLSRAAKALARATSSAGNESGNTEKRKKGDDEEPGRDERKIEEVRKSNSKEKKSPEETSNKTEAKVTREARWKQLANEKNSRLSKGVRETIRRKNGKDVYKEHGLELAHRPGKPAAQGNDYGDALPKTKSIHRNQHRFYTDKKNGGFVLNNPPKSDNAWTFPKKGVFERLDKIEAQIKKGGQ